MQRWFFADEAEICVAPTVQQESSVTSTPKESLFKPTFRPWTFRVYIKQNLCENEMAAICGSCEVLGNWQFENCLTMDKSDTEANTWTVTVDLPFEEATQYRYLLCAKGMCPDKEKTIVRFWETHLQPRSIPEYAENTPIRQEVFGLLNNVTKIDRGWLTSETIVQIKFFNAPFTWKKPIKLKQELLLYVKVIPVYIIAHNVCDPVDDSGTKFLDISKRSMQGDFSDILIDGDRVDLSRAFSFCEVGSLKGTESGMSQMPEFGSLCSKDDLLVFQLIIGDFQKTAYKVDLYLYSYKCAADEPPWYFGYHYIMPELFQNSYGSFTVPITCASTHRPMGVMHLGYHIIKPAKSLELEMSKTFLRYWKPDKFGIYIGHRGSGNSGPDSILRENTIASMKSAFDQGADIVEMDLHLTKDMIPVVYHDFNIRLSHKSVHPDMHEYPLHNGEHKYRSIPISKFTWEQLLNLKDIHEKSPPERCSTESDMRQYQCIQMLSDMFDLLPHKLGFALEIKWSQLQEDCQYEADYKPQIDRNEFVDCILDMVFRNAGSRVVVFSCFDPDICAMVRFKQNRYPVMQVSISAKSRRKKFMDPRGNCIYLAMSQALAMEFLGVVVHVGNLLEDPVQVG